MPKTPESGGIPLPASWPPFNRDMWDDRAHCLLESLSRMGHEDEDYASVPAAINMSKGSLARAAKGRQESSIAKQATKEGANEDAAKVRPDDEEEEEVEEETRLRVKPTRVLKTFEQRRKFIVKAMDMHRHTIGGGRSGRRGRAECVSFFRRVLEILDEQYEEALKAEGVGDDEDEEGSPRGIKGKYVKSEEYGERSSSSEEEEDSSEEEEEEGGVEEEEEEVSDEEEEEVKDVTPEQKPTKPPRKGPGRPRKSETTALSEPPKKPKAPKPAPRVVLNEQDFFDQHNDLCEVCNQPGEVLCCATCNLVFHVHCARPKLQEEPPDDWKCAYCWAAGVMGGKKDGKERRKAAQACREMERMRRDIKERTRKRAAGEIMDVESGLEESEDDGDTNPAGVEASGGAGGDGVRVSVEDAAVSGCRKCVKELATGVKTRKTHDDYCPRKWKSVGKPTYASPSAGGVTPTATASVKREKESSAEEEPEDVEDEEVEEDEEDEEDEEEVESEEKEEEENEDDDNDEEEEDIEADSLFSPSSQTSGLRDGGMVPLEISAAAGCTKCQKELMTGEKTRKVHADNCPRKYRGAYMLLSPADMPSTNPLLFGTVLEADTKAQVDTEAKESEADEEPKQVTSSITTASAAAATETTCIAVFSDPDAEAPPVKRRKVGRPPSKKSSVLPAAELPTMPKDGPAPLEEGAATGCIKCRKELATGEKTRKTHSDDCPRKWKAAGRPPTGTPSPASAAAAMARQQQQQLLQKQAATGGKLPGGGEKSQEKGAAAGDPMSPPPKLPRRPGRPPRKSLPAETADTDYSAAAMSPLKPPGRPSVKSAPAETVDAPLAEAVDNKSSSAAMPPLKPRGRPPKSSIKSAPAEIVDAADAEAVDIKSSAAAMPPLKPRGRPPKSSVKSAPAEIVDAPDAEAVDSNSSAAAMPPLKSPGRPGRPLVKSATAESAPVGMSLDRIMVPRREKRTRLEMTNSAASFSNTSTITTAAENAYAAAKYTAEEEEEESAAIAAIGDLAEATAKEHEENYPGNSSWMDTDGKDKYAETFRGGGGAGEVTLKLERSNEVIAVDVTSTSAVLPGASTTKGATSRENEDENMDDTCVLVKPFQRGGQMNWAPVKAEVAAFAPSVPKREPEGLPVYSSLMLGDMSALTHANNGRMRRSRKKPPLFNPQDGPDYSWRSGDNTPENICGKAAGKDSGGPEHLRGGGRPKKEDTASPAPATPASTFARRGRPPTKQTKGGGTPKKNAKRAPIKKETNDSIPGVGVLNRKPGSLFDCSACLDIGKIKICCYCACRLCFNKFGKEQTILCDKCDQEYHTFCLGLDKIPDAEWECPACIENEEKKVLLEQRKKVCFLNWCYPGHQGP